MLFKTPDNFYMEWQTKLRDTKQEYRKLHGNYVMKI